MLFVCYLRCSTCQKARKWLDAQGIQYELRDIKTENPTEEELRLWRDRGGLPMKKLWNTSGMGYRALDLKNRLPAMDEAEQLALLATDGMLVKRPILVGDDFVLTGFREAEWAEKLR
jgi:arsenate reductase